MSTQKRKITLKKLSALNTVWHPESGLVFKSQKERMVIGSYVDGKLVDLDDEALTLCEEWNFKPDESLLEDEGDENQDEDDTEAEVEAEGKEVENEEESRNDSSGEDGKGEDELIVDSPPHMEVNPEQLIREITKQLEEKLQPACNVLQKRIDDHLTTIHSRDRTIEDNLKTIEANQKEIEELRAKYDAIQKKFDAMKSLFN